MTINDNKRVFCCGIHVSTLVSYYFHTPPPPQKKKMSSLEGSLWMNCGSEVLFTGHEKQEMYIK